MANYITLSSPQEAALIVFRLDPTELRVAFNILNDRFFINFSSEINVLADSTVKNGFTSRTEGII